VRSIRKPDGAISWDGKYRVNVYGYDASGKFYYVGTLDWDKDTLRHHLDTKNGDYTLTHTGANEWDIAMGKHLRIYVDSDEGQILVMQNTGGEMWVGAQL
jgi:hypothetical protein